MIPMSNLLKCFIPTLKNSTKQMDSMHLVGVDQNWWRLKSEKESSTDKKSMKTSNLLYGPSTKYKKNKIKIEF